MKHIVVRGTKLYVKLKGVDGAWGRVATGLVVGEEQKAEAIRKAAQRKIDARVDAGDTLSDRPLTVALYAERWIAERKRRDIGSAQDDAGRLAHALPIIGSLRLDEVRTRHIRDLVRGLKARSGPAADQLAPRTARHVFSVTKTMFSDAVVDELIETSPCLLKKGELPKKMDKDPTWRSGAVFTRSELEQLLSDDRIPLDRRVINAILFVAGLRFGELAALKWSAYDAEMAPLGKLLVAWSYDFKKKRLKYVKSGVPREVPVHPTLATVLAEWRRTGWEAMMGRPPTADDLVMPPRPEATDEPYRNVNRALRRFTEDLDRLGLRRRRQHDLRRSYVSIAMADGARKEMLERTSHGARGEIIDMYNTPPWAAVCDEVAKIRIVLRDNNHHDDGGGSAAPSPHVDAGGDATDGVGQHAQVGGDIAVSDYVASGLRADVSDGEVVDFGPMVQSRPIGPQKTENDTSVISLEVIDSSGVNLIAPNPTQLAFSSSSPVSRSNLKEPAEPRAFFMPGGAPSRTCNKGCNKR